MEDKIVAINYVRDEMLTNPNVQGVTIWNAAKLAASDQYLYDLMIDWMKENNNSNKEELLDEVIMYTEEVIRTLKIKRER